MRPHGAAGWLLAAAALPARVAPEPSLLDVLDEVLLKDILESYETYEASACTSSASGTTSFTFDWPGTNAASRWSPHMTAYEQSLFQAKLAHADVSPGKNSWELRIGTGGNMYSVYYPDRHGETMPSQFQADGTHHDDAPWMDEVQQSVSVNGHLNRGNEPANCDATATTKCDPYFIHQAGAYQRDPPDTDVPFFSPSLAKHCSGRSCYFASWGTQAHVATSFTSPVMYINRYTDCGGGVIEHDQMVHNFADPNNALSTSDNVDQTYFNMPWGGVRSSALPWALEPTADAGGTVSLKYADPDNVDFLYLCTWAVRSETPFGWPTGNDHDGPVASGVPWPGQVRNLVDLPGYTTFASRGLLVNEQFVDPATYYKPWCRKPGADCYASKTTCMEPCTDAQVENDGYERIQLKVAAGATPNCASNGVWSAFDLIQVKCNMRDTGFGTNAPSLTLPTWREKCAPWAQLGFVNNRTGEVLVFATDATEAVNMVNTIFDNTGDEINELLIDVRPTSDLPPDYNPSTYDPHSLDSFTYVFGGTGTYGSLSGNHQRRVGSTKRQGYGTRDYTVHTIRWRTEGSRLVPGNAHISRLFYFGSDLGSAEATATDLETKTFADTVLLGDWTPRKIDVYESGGKFVVMAAETTGGTSTSCASGPTVAYSGYSTPQANLVPFFYVTCGDSTYLGPDPYHFTPNFSNFPGHGTYTSKVRVYRCNGLDSSVRPTWKMMGFFPAVDAGRNDLVYDDTESLCPEGTKSPTSSPSKSPTSPPTTPLPTSPPTTPFPTSPPSKSPTSPPTAPPTTPPTAPPTTPFPTTSPTTPFPTTSPTTSPPTKEVSDWYPDWTGQESICKSDDQDRAPSYMRISRLYFENSLSSCCQRFFNYDYHACMGEASPAPTGYYPNWDKGENKCLDASEGIGPPGYMRNIPQEWLFPDIDSCCERYYNWDKSACIINSGGDMTMAGSSKWFVDWTTSKCVKDCHEDSGDAKCGGLAKNWDDLHTGLSECCERLWWLPRQDCFS